MPKRTAFSFLGICLVLLALGQPVAAEVLLIDAIAEEPPNSSNGMPRPRNGESMLKVEQRFGSPDNTQGPVGDPAITRWDYPSFSVYFEHNRVITSVVHR